ncbi:phosphatase PAP2 family protein [uncultured Pseudonocardia sp.]|uniref:phosphatase PAP2 family protein n=1 Tax=uncultured Pseudonocardia sp. TaxID=211455 RepID=UPI002628B484|nr:phosphatase PAP2 family protein [uncultured Pseudonocardia sp.]
MTAHLPDPQLSAPTRMLRWLAVACVAVVAVLGLLVGVHWAPLLDLDQTVVGSAHTAVLAQPWLLVAAQVVTAIGSPVAVDVVTAVAAVVLLIGRRWRATVLLVVARFGELACETGIKELLARARPHLADPVAVASGYSFPSGHAAGTAAGYGALVLLALPLMARRWRPLLLAAGVVLSVAVAASRVLLGVHYPSDVTAGAALGVVWIAVAAFLATRPLPARRTQPNRGHDQ